MFGFVGSVLCGPLDVFSLTRRDIQELGQNLKDTCEQVLQNFGEKGSFVPLAEVNHSRFVREVVKSMNAGLEKALELTYGCFSKEPSDESRPVLVISEGEVIFNPEKKEVTLEDFEKALPVVTKLDFESSVLSNYAVSIPEGIFSRCANLRSVYFSNQLQTIETSAFSGCSHLKQLSFPQSLVTVSDGAFKDCTNLSELDIQAGHHIAFIGDNAFENCALKVSFISDSNSHKEDSTVENLIIKEGVSSIPAYAFQGCQKLKNIFLPASLKKIGKYAFSECYVLSRAVFPPLFETLEGWAFEGDAKLSEVTFPEGQNKIGWGAFNHCSALLKVKFPASLKTLEHHAFVNCPNLETVDMSQVTVDLDWKDAFDTTVQNVKHVICNSSQEEKVRSVFTEAEVIVLKE